MISDKTKSLTISMNDNNCDIPDLLQAFVEKNRLNIHKS